MDSQVYGDNILQKFWKASLPSSSSLPVEMNTHLSSHSCIKTPPEALKIYCIGCTFFSKHNNSLWVLIYVSYISSSDVFFLVSCAKLECHFLFLFHCSCSWSCLRFFIQITTEGLQYKHFIFYLKTVQSKKIAVLVSGTVFYQKVLALYWCYYSIYVFLLHTFPHLYSQDKYLTLNLFRGMCNYRSIEALINRMKY